MYVIPGGNAGITFWPKELFPTATAVPSDRNSTVFTDGADLRVRHPPQVA